MDAYQFERTIAQLKTDLVTVEQLLDIAARHPELEREIAAIRRKIEDMKKVLVEN